MDTFRDKSKSGFEDDVDWVTTYKQCSHLEHSPPTHIVVPPGKVYRHVCPGCGNTQYLRSSSVSW